MAEYTVNTDGLRRIADTVGGLQRDLDAVAMKLGAMQLGSILQIKASTAMIAQINDCRRAASNQSDDMGKLARGLDELAQLYDTYENNLKEPKTQAEADEQGIGKEEESKSPFPDWKEVIKWLSKKSVPFSLIATWNGFGKGGWGGFVDGTKNLLYAIGNTASSLFGKGTGSENLLKFLGLNKNGVGGLGESWNKWLSGMKIGENATLAEKTAVVCKWAGYAMSFVGEAVDNAEEFGDNFYKDGRFWGETVIEGATDVALGIGAGILVAAALPASAPAIVVGAAGAAVVWAGNALVEGLTGQDIDEWVSDLVYGDGKVAEVKEWVGDKLDDAGEALKDIGSDIAGGVKSAGKAVCKWAKGLFS